MRCVRRWRRCWATITHPRGRSLGICPYDRPSGQPLARPATGFCGPCRRLPIPDNPAGMCGCGGLPVRHPDNPDPGVEIWRKRYDRAWGRLADAGSASLHRGRSAPAAMGDYGQEPPVPGVWGTSPLAPVWLARRVSLQLTAVGGLENVRSCSLARMSGQQRGACSLPPAASSTSAHRAVTIENMLSACSVP